MTPEQALQLLDSLVSQIRLGRAEHVQAQQAAQVLAKAIEAPKADAAAAKLKAMPEPNPKPKGSPSFRKGEARRRAAAAAKADEAANKATMRSKTDGG